MPLNEIENHPFLNYLNSSNIDWSIYTKWIVGTFPIYQLTDTSNSVENYKSWESAAFVDFFYGSKINEFWFLLSKSLNLPMPVNKAECITILENNNVYITDVIKQCSRIGCSASDNDLRAIDLNEKLNRIYENCINLSVIFFTSELAKKFFCKIFGVEYHSNRIEQLAYKGKNITLICLPSPSPSGSQRLPSDLNFNKWLYFNFRNQITREKWSEYFLDKGKGKLKRFITSNSLCVSTALTRIYKEKIYELAFAEDFQRLEDLSNLTLPTFENGNIPALI